MGARAQLDADGLLGSLRAAAAVLDDHRAALDRLDRGDEWEDGGWDQEGPDDAQQVRPGDAGTPAGTDLAATLTGAVSAAAGSTTLAQIADALVVGPRQIAAGPAGRDLAQVLAGLADAIRNADVVDASRFAIGLELAAERITLADDGRHAGCLPAVLAAAADAALGAVDAGAELADVIVAAADEGLAELEDGPRSNPDLVDRGVVDAAAAGLLLVLDVLASVVTGEPLPAPPVEAPVAATLGPTSCRFRVRCLVEPHDGCGLESANWLESTWFELGELVEFRGTSSPWRAELVTTVPGAAIEAIAEVGRPRELHVGLADPTD